MIITREKAEEMQAAGKATIEPGYIVVDKDCRWQVVTDHDNQEVHHYLVGQDES